MNVEVGDWIRFRHGGRLVISAVEYIVRRAEWDSTLEAMTDVAQVSFKDIIELRKQGAPPSIREGHGAEPTP